MANLFSIDNGKITYNKVSSNELNSITNKKKKLEELKNSYKNANQIVNNDIQKIGNYLNRNGQNINKNNPFQANVVSNAMININKKNLNGRVTLQDVVQDHSNLLNSEKGQELKNNLRISKNERAWSEYNYNQEKVNNEETTLADKTIGTVTRGVKDLFSNMTDSRDIVDDKGKTTRLPSYNELKQNKVSQDYKTGIGKFLGDASYNISKIGASTLMNIPTLGVGGSAIYWSDMYFDSYNSAKNQGYSEDKAFSYALANTGFEYIVGKFLGSATKGLTGGQTSELSNAISNGVNKLISNPKIASIIGNAGSEATEEFIQEYLDNINKLVTLNGSKNPKDYIDVLLSKDILKDAFYSAGVGAVSGGLLQGINNKEGKYAQYNTNLLKSFKNQLEISKSNLTDKETIAKYDSVINDINDYISKPFGNESKVEKTLPTVYDIVAQENTKETEFSAGNTANNSITTTYESSVSNNNIQQQNESIEHVKKLKKISKWAFDKANRLKSFKEQIKDFRTNKLPTGTQLIVTDNSESLSYANLDNNPIVINQANIKKILQGKHSNIDTNIIENLDSELNNTVMALDSRTIKNAKVVVLNQTDLNGNPIIATIHQGKTSATIEVNELTSVYDKNEFQQFINNTIQDGKNIYTNEKTEEWLLRNRLQLPTRFTNNSVAMWKKPSTLTNSNAPSSTSKTKGSDISPTLIDNNIPQINENVKSGIPTTNDMKNIDIDTIKQTKGNIPINRELFKKYANTTELFADSKNNYNGEVEIKNNINEIENVDINNSKISEIKNIAKNIFEKYNEKNYFINDNNKIFVNKTGIDESITKIFESRQQRELLKEHLLVFSDLGDIIEHAKLVNQVPEAKGRSKYKSWNYYYDGLKINNELYNFEFEVVSMANGENHYRVQKLEKINNKKTEISTGSTKSTLPVSEIPVSDNNIPQINENVKLPIVSNNDMQNNENNTNKVKLSTEKNPLGYIPKDPTRESSYDDNNSKNTYRETVKKITIEDKIEKAIRNNSYKSVNFATKSVQDYLEFNRNEKKSFRDKITKYAKMTKEDLTNPNTFNELKSIVDEYANKEINFVDEDLKNIKNEIRETRIRIPDTVKNNMTDYNGFRKNNFGKLRLSNSGESIDVIWQDLTERYPQYFDSNITGEEDMLNELSTFMDKDIVFTEKYRIDDAELNRATTKLFNKLIQESFSNSDIEEMQNELEARAARRTRQVVREELLTEMGITIDDLTNSKDIQAPNFQITDPIRVNEKVFGREIGKKINEATIERTKHNTAEKIRWLNQERKDIKDLGIKPRSKESAAVQKYGEKQYLNQYGEMVDYTDHDLATEFPNVATQIKIKKAAEVIRKKYDNYIDQINDVLLDMGYDAIPKRNDYMRHFEELGDIFSQTGVPFNLNDMSAEDLPTDINGLTEFNRPGKNWFANAQKRTGEKTTYDAITGIDIYLEGAGNLIFHTEDIQRYRALAKMIRDTYGKTNGWDNIGDLTGKELDNRIKDIQDNKLSKYAAWLDEQANSLAGKKGAIDRGTERILGRKGYTFLNTIKKQVGSNMVGFNIGSSLTNLISSTFASSKTNKIAFVKGTISTIQNMIHNDGFIDKSDFLTSRFGSNQLSTKLWQKASNAGQIFMTGTDYFTANQIVRSKYFEGLSKGMSEQNAINYADDFASRVMGDRSQGATPEIFNSKTLGLFTQFQLEVNNQWQYMIHDSKMDFQYNSSINGGLKAGATVLFQLGQLAAYSYFFNELFESLIGRRPAFDPIEILKILFGIGDDEDDEEKSFDERCEKAKEMLIEQLPFASILTNGGRIPISEALPITELVSGEDKFGNKKSRLDIIKEALPYYILPGGYGQIKKGISGAKMYDKSLPVAGSYTDSGNLRFTVDDDITSKFKSFLFGQYSSKEAQDYIDSGFKTISANNIDEMKDLGMTSSQYRSLKNKINTISKTTDENGYQKYTDNSNNIYWYDKNNKVVYDSNYNKVNKSITKFKKANSNEQAIEYIVNSNLTKNQKNILINNMLKTENLDSYGFQKYTGEEYDNKKGEYVEKTYWYDKENNILYDSDYNEVNNDILGRLNKVNSIKYNSDDYKKYDSYEEYIYANQNKEKYNWLKDNNISYATYTKSKENKKIYNYAYNNQNIYNLSKVITNDFEKYYKIQQEINNIESSYYSNGKEVPNSRKNKVIKYVNSLNLSIPQKALLIKMEYSSYKKYDKQIAEYVNSMNISFLDKASILKKAGFTSYDKQIINYVNKMNITKTEKEEILEEMGFTIRNGRVYS